MIDASRDGPFTSTPVCAGEAAPVSMRALWLGLAGAPIAWSVQEVVDTALVSHSCYPGGFPLSTPVIGGLSGIAVAVSVTAMIFAVLALVTALRSWRTMRERQGVYSTRSLEAAPPAGRSRFMALAGIAVSTLFLGGIVLQTVSIALVHPCAGLAK